MLLDMAFCAPFLTIPAISEALLISAAVIPDVTAISYRCSKQGMQFTAVAAPIAIRTSVFSTNVVSLPVLFVSIATFLLVGNAEYVASYRRLLRLKGASTVRTPHCCEAAA
jgi:hypothetical protein